MSDDSNALFLGRVKAQRLTSIEEDCKREREQILVDQTRFAKYGTNSVKKAQLIKDGTREELTHERFREEDQAND